MATATPPRHRRVTPYPARVGKEWPELLAALPVPGSRAVVRRLLGAGLGLVEGEPFSSDAAALLRGPRGRLVLLMRHPLESGQLVLLAIGFEPRERTELAALVVGGRP